MNRRDIFVEDERQEYYYFEFFTSYETVIYTVI